jgi:hypothetical protein
MCYLVSQKDKGRTNMEREDRREDWVIGRKGIFREYLVLRVPFQIKRELRQLARKERVSVSDLVRMAIEKFLKETNLEKQT